MNLADVFTFLFGILGFLIVVIGYWLLAFALTPQLVERTAARLGRAPVKTTLLGAVTLVPLVIGGLMLSAKVPNVVGKIICLAVALFAVLGALLGSAGIALGVGKGLHSSRDAGEPWRRVLRGGVVLSLTFVLPFVGTFIMLPAALFAGFGALLLGRAAAVPAHAAAPEPASVPPLPAATT